MAYFEKKQTKLEKFLNCSTFKTQDQRDRDFELMKIEDEKAAKRKKAKEDGPSKKEEPKETITRIAFNKDNDAKIMRITTDLEPEQKYLERIMELGGTPSKKKEISFGNSQPKRLIPTYTNYDEIEIEIIPEGKSGKKKSQRKGNKNA